MRITAVRTTVDDLAEAEDFWGRRFGPPTRRDGDRVQVRLGGTSLALEAGAPGTSADHLAITIPTGSFPDARRWLQERVPLLARSGQDEFEGPPGWDSRSLYFSGPSGAVLELIERRRLRNARSAAGFGADALLGVSEVGVAVDDVRAEADVLREAGIGSFGDPPGDGFAALGDDAGLLILVRAGRPWLPTADRLAGRRPLWIELAGDARRSLRIGDAIVETTAASGAGA